MYGAVFMRSIKNYIYIVLGGSLMGFSLAFFLVPSQISAGGVSGAATVLYYLFGLPVGVMVFVLNIPIFILALVTFDKKFLMTSLLGTLSLSVSTQIFELLAPELFLEITDDMLLCAVFGGALYGTGLGFAITAGGTTGGTDILSLVLKKKFPNMSVGQLIIAIDGLIIIVSAVCFRRIDTLLYSVVMLYVSSYVLDATLAGVDFAKTVYIISEKLPQIAEAAAEKLKRGSTVLIGYSNYSGKDRNVLMCVMRKYQVPKLRKLVEEIDADAFVIVMDAKEVIGQGFKTVK